MEGLPGLTRDRGYLSSLTSPMKDSSQISLGCLFTLLTIWNINFLLRASLFLSEIFQKDWPVRILCSKPTSFRKKYRKISLFSVLLFICIKTTIWSLSFSVWYNFSHVTFIFLNYNTENYHFVASFVQVLKVWRKYPDIDSPDSFLGAWNPGINIMEDVQRGMSGER